MTANLLFFLANTFLLAHGFNIDTTYPEVHEGPPGSLFGFSVTQHSQSGNVWSLVGAPKADNDYQPGLERPGAVYKCNKQTSCEQIPFDRRGSNKETDLYSGELKQIDNKNHQWFGVTVTSSGPNGVIAACAHRYVYYTRSFEDRDPVGVCFTAENDFSDPMRFTPCTESGEFGWHREGYCQAGMSAQITKNGEDLIMGAPGSVFSQGQVFASSLGSKSLLKTSTTKTKEDDFSYLGYALALGEFTGDEKQEFVVGAPRANTLKGLVKIFYLEDRQYHLWQNLSGEQLASNFGASLCVQDLNGDGYDDIVVGAPLYATTSLAGTSKWEVGRVYVYYQDPQGESLMEPAQILTGAESGARFGLSLACLADVNQDGFKDLAVGAPYGGKDKNGVVYVYHGSHPQIRPQPAQVIEASSLNVELSAFGYSISGLLDMDNNQYPDLLIGAHGSDKAVVLRSKPVIDVEVSVELEPEFIDLEKSICVHQNNSDIPCFSITTCFQYKGLEIPAELALEYTTMVDTIKPIQKRVDKTAYTTLIDLARGSMSCQTSIIFLKAEVADKYTPIGVEVNYLLVEPSANTSSQNLFPVLNQYTSTTITKQAHILNNCGEDKVCIPDLILEPLLLTEELYAGSDGTINLNLQVINHGEDAFQSKLTLYLPQELHLARVEKRDADFHVECEEESGDFRTVVCYVGNPLPADHQIGVGIVFSVKTLNGTTDSLDILMDLNSTNGEDFSTLEDNFISVSVPIKVKATLNIKGASIPEQVRYNSGEEKKGKEDKGEEEIGPSVTHLYEVANLGPSTISEVEAYISWPLKTVDDNYLLYYTGVESGQPCSYITPTPTYVVRVNGSSKSAGQGLSPVGSYQGDLSQGKADDEDFQKIREEYLECVDANCVVIKCILGPLKEGDLGTVRINSRLWLDSILKDDSSGNEEYIMSSVMSSIYARAVGFPYSMQPEQYPSAASQIVTEINPPELKPKVIKVPVWVIVVSALGGMVLLVGLVLVLKGAGFFKRKRIKEYQPCSQQADNDRMTDIKFQVYNNGNHVAINHNNDYQPCAQIDDGGGDDDDPVVDIKLQVYNNGNHFAIDHNLDKEYHYS